MPSETVKILMERDDISRQEAEKLIDDTREELLNGNHDAILDILGLENDYIFDII